MDPVYVCYWNVVDEDDNRHRFKCESIEALDKFLCSLERQYGYTGYRYSVHTILPLNYV